MKAAFGVELFDQHTIAGIDLGGKFRSDILQLVKGRQVAAQTQQEDHACQSKERDYSQKFSPAGAPKSFLQPAAGFF